MPKKLAYSAWARMDMAWLPDEQKQALRHNWFSDSGKAKKYDLYKESAKFQGFDYDNPPESYWKQKEQGWHGIAGVFIGMLGVLGYFLAQMVGNSTGQGKR